MSQPSAAPSLKCPVCSARFRGSVTCSRCGSDLSGLMRIAARAWSLRRRCRQALDSADLPRALALWRQARRLHDLAG